MAAADEKLVDLWTQRKADAQNHRNLWEDRWVTNWELYRNTRRTPRTMGQQSWRSNRQLPDAFRVIETMVPHHIKTIFRTNDWFSVESPGAPPNTYPLLVKSLLLHGWRKADGFRKTINAVKLGNILGHFIAKVHWSVELGEKEVLDFSPELDADGEVISQGPRRVTVPDVRHNGPQITIPDLMNVWQDPSGQMRWAIEKIPGGMADLNELNRQFNGKLYKNLKQLNARRAMSTAIAGGRGPSSDRPSIADQTEGISDYLTQDPDHVELWQCWGWVPPDIRRYEDTQWRLQVIADEGTLIRDEKAPTPDHRPPYINVQGVPIPNQLYGDSVLSYVGDLIELRSNIENLRHDEILLQIFGTHVVHADANVDGRFFKHPGGYMKVRPPFGRPISEVFQQVPRHPILPESYTESAVKERQILDATGATEPFQGSFAGGGSHRTASEFQGTVNLGSARIELATMWMDESFKKPTLKKMFQFYQTRLTDPEMIRLAGQGNVAGEVDLGDLEWDVDIYVDSGLFGSLDQTKFASLNQFLQTMYANPETAIHIDPRKLTNVISARLGITGMDDVLRTPEEVAQIKQQQQQQALAEAAAGGSSAPK